MVQVYVNFTHQPVLLSHFGTDSPATPFAPSALRRVEDSPAPLLQTRTTSLAKSPHQYHSIDVSRPLFSYSYGLYCNAKSVNPFSFNRFHTLAPKHPGSGVVVRSFTSSTSIASSTSLAAVGSKLSHVSPLCSRRVNHPPLHSLLAVCKAPRSSNLFRIRTSAKPASNPFRMRTSKTKDLKPCRMNTSEKEPRGERRESSISAPMFEDSCLIRTPSPRWDRLQSVAVSLSNKPHALSATPPAPATANIFRFSAASLDGTLSPSSNSASRPQGECE